MKALSIIFALLISVTLMGWGGKKFDNVSKDEMFQKMSEKKYSILKEKVDLTADEEKIILPILKDYDKKRFEAMSQHFEKGKELRDAETKDYSKILEHEKEMLESMKKGLDMEKAKIADLEKAGVKVETIVKIQRFEKHFMHKMMKGPKHGKGPHHECEEDDCPKHHEDDNEDF